MTTGELDAIAAENIRAAGAMPSFLGYGHPPFPATICVSVNDEIVHGIPGDRVIAEGDIVSIDCGAIVDGWHGDAAVTIAVGEVPDEALELMRVTEESMWRGIAAAALGGHVGDISHAVQSYVRGRRVTSGSSRTTPGTGSARPCTSRRTCPTSAGRAAARAWSRAWRWPSSRWSWPGSRGAARSRTTGPSPPRTARSSAHFENTFTLTPRGAWVLTALDGGQAKLAELGVPYGGH